MSNYDREMWIMKWRFGLQFSATRAKEPDKGCICWLALHLCKEVISMKKQVWYVISKLPIKPLWSFDRYSNFIQISRYVIVVRLSYTERYYCHRCVKNCTRQASNLGWISCKIMSFSRVKFWMSHAGPYVLPVVPKAMIITCLAPPPASR